MDKQTGKRGWTRGGAKDKVSAGDTMSHLRGWIAPLARERRPPHTIREGAMALGLVKYARKQMSVPSKRKPTGECVDSHNIFPKT